MGWKFAITTTDGRVFTNIEPVAVEQPKKITRKKLYIFKDLGIESRLLESVPGEEVHIGPFPWIPLANLQKAVSNNAIKVYGKNNFRTSVNKEAEVVVFVGGPKVSMNDLDAAIAAVAQANKQTHSVTDKPQ
jgi:hypothetical protein